MTREQKIKSLNAIREGQLTPEDIKEAKCFVFRQKDRGEGEGWTSDFSQFIYGETASDVVEFTDEEMKDFINNIDLINHRRKAVGLPPDTVIRVCYENRFKSI